ncbi:MAG: hypothetical protein WDM90_13520 [Ferruginibacter sp.]
MEKSVTSLHRNGLQVGQTVMSGDNVAPELENALLFKNMPLGTNVHNIEMQPGQGWYLGKKCRVHRLN